MIISCCWTPICMRAQVCRCDSWRESWGWGRLWALASWLNKGVLHIGQKIPYSLYQLVYYWECIHLLLESFNPLDCPFYVNSQSCNTSCKLHITFWHFSILHERWDVQSYTSLCKKVTNIIVNPLSAITLSPASKSLITRISRSIRHHICSRPIALI